MNGPSSSLPSFQPNLYFVELTVANIELSLEWYSGILNLQTELVDSKGKFALLRGGATRLALKQGESKPGSVILSFQVENLEQFRHHIQEKGITIDQEIRFSEEGYRRLRLKDPDGYFLTVFSWNRKDQPGSGNQQDDSC